jgi:Proteasome non-ATPase 26S subunit
MSPGPALQEKPAGSNEETRESAQDLGLRDAEKILHEIYQQLEAPSTTDRLSQLLQDLRETAGVADIAAILARQVLLDDGSSALGHFPALKTTAYLASTLFPFRAACLAAVHNLLQGSPPSAWTASTELIRLVVSLLHDEQVAVANAASDLLLELCQAAAGVRFLSSQNKSRNASSSLDDRGMFLQAVMTALVESGYEVWDRFVHGQFSPPQYTKNHASVVCIRFAATILKLVTPVTVAGILEYASVPVNDSTLSPLGLVEQMLNSNADIVQNDFLFRMSLLDLLETLANECSRRGPLHSSDDRLRKWLYSYPICGPVVKLAGGGNVAQNGNDSTDDLPDPFLGGPALRLVAALCGVEPIVEPVQPGTEDEKMEEDQSQMRLLQGFHRALHNFDVTGELDRLAMVDALSSFASAHGHLALGLILNDPVTRQAWLSLSVAQPKLKCVIIHSVALVLDPRDSTPLLLMHDSADDYETAASPTTVAKTSLFRALGETNQVDTPQLLMGLAKSPLPEVRLAAMRTMGATVRGTPSGAQELLSHPDCLTWLLKRDGESTAEGRVSKYDVVRTVARHPILRGLLDSRVLQQMEQYIQQGPHYAKAQQWDVAVQD